MGLFRSASILLAAVSLLSCRSVTATAATSAAAPVPTKEAVDAFMSKLQDAVPGCGLNSTDLSSLQSSTDRTFSTGSWTYYLNMCGVVSSVACVQHKSSSMVCQINNGNVYNLASYDHGSAGTSDKHGVWTYLNDDPKAGIQAVYTNGDGNCYDHGTPFYDRTLTMHFACANSHDDTFAVQNPYNGNDCQYLLTMNTPAACPPGSSSSSGLSGGWIFVIILCVCIPIYVVAGCFYKSKRMGATGIERCPNVDFWRDLPRLVIEGCVFSFQKTKQLCSGKTGASGSSGTYETI